MARKLKRILWLTFIVPALGLGVFIVGSEGLRVMFSALGTKLSRVPIPGFHWLFSLEGLHRLDAAHIWALVLFVSVWGAWHKFFQIYLKGKDSQKAQDAILFLSAALLLFDGVVFYKGISETSGWGGSALQIWPLIATGLYVLFTVYAAFKAVDLED